MTNRRVAPARHAGSSPTFIQPMASRIVDTLPDGANWMYELKFDGYRALLIKNGNRA